MRPETWQKIGRAALATALGAAFTGFALGFAPGWANRWPFGWTIHVVWAVGMAIVVFLLLLSLGTALGAGVGLACSRRGLGLQYGRLMFLGWLCAMAAVGFILSLGVYDHSHTAAWQMWPNGYPNPR